MPTLLCSIFLASVAFAAPANFSGKWALQAAGGRGGPTILILNQAGSEVTGTITVRVDAGSGSPLDPEIHNGKVDGETITFYVWSGVDQPTKTVYKGTISPSGEEIAFSVTGVRIPGGINGPSRAGDPNAAQTISARRMK